MITTINLLASPFFTTPFQPCVYQSLEDVVIPFKILGGESQVVQWLFGKNITSIILRNPGPSDGFVGIVAPLSRILPIDLAIFYGGISCQPDAFLCSINDMKVSITFDQRAQNVVAGAAFLRQKLSGQGLAFIAAGGSVLQKKLDVREDLAVDVSSIAAGPPQ